MQPISDNDLLRAAQSLADAGKTKQACETYRRALERHPGVPEIRLEFGRFLMHTGQVGEAIGAFQQLICHHPSCIEAHIELCKTLLLFGDGAGALETAVRAFRFNPQLKAAGNRLGETVAALSEYAFQRCQQSIENSNSLQELFRVAKSLLRSGKAGAAQSAYCRILELSPGDATARYMLGCCSSDQMLPRAPGEFVEQLFDKFAADFDRALTAIHYRAPSVIADIVADLEMTHARKLDILELGCGTGLSGCSLDPSARRLVGVDLSAKMLELAQRRGIYDALHKADLLDFLEQAGDRFDTIVAADVFVYFGDLQPVCHAARTLLPPGGTLIFTAEAWPTADSDATFCMQDGRYRHSPAYLTRVLTAGGYAVRTLDEFALRTESTEPVGGLLVVAERVS